MDPRERMNSIEVALRTALEGARADIWTSLPGIVESFDPEKQTAQIQPAIMAAVQDKTGVWTNVKLPLIPDVPVQFPGCDSAVLTFPIKKGDEGTLVFSARCIDAFWQSGGVQPQAEQRMHDLSDPVFFPGRLSQPKKLADFNNDAVELRAADGSRFLRMTETGFRIKGNLEVDGAINLGGELLALDGAAYAQAIRTTGDVIAMYQNGDVSLSGHTHSQPVDSHGDTEADTSPPLTGG